MTNSNCDRKRSGDSRGESRCPSCGGRSSANHVGEKYGSSKIATRRGTVVIIARVLYPSTRDVFLSVREEGWLVTTSYPFFFSDSRHRGRLLCITSRYMYIHSSEFIYTWECNFNLLRSY